MGSEVQAKGPGGQPPKLLSDDQFEQLKGMASIMATCVECASAFGMTDDTLVKRLRERGYDNWPHFLGQHSSSRLMSIRRAQIEKALKGDTGMLIWLGKQYLGQSDHMSVDAHLTAGPPTEVRRTIIDVTPPDDIDDAEVINDN